MSGTRYGRPSAVTPGRSSPPRSSGVYTADVPELDRDAAEQISGLFLPPTEPPPGAPDLDDY
ncbi:MAG: hypothetical protein ACRDS0_14010 [Pseudonocardiaceae bacterium]